MMSRTLMGILLLLGAVGCGDRPSPANGSASGPGGDGRYGIGQPARDDVIAMMNHDVGSDGADLPPGSGTVAAGATLYAAQCAMCHGVNGEGMAPFPQLLGRDVSAENFVFAKDPKLPHTIGNYWPYATTLFDYVKRAMPLLSPGSLTDSQVYAVVAFLLAKDQVIPDSTTLDATSLRAVQMPYRDRFVPDDRKAGVLR